MYKNILFLKDMVMISMFKKKYHLSRPLWEATLMSLDWTAETNWRYRMELKPVQRLEFVARVSNTLMGMVKGMNM